MLVATGVSHMCKGGANKDIRCHISDLTSDQIILQTTLFVGYQCWREHRHTGCLTWQWLKVWQANGLFFYLIFFRGTSCLDRELDMLVAEDLLFAAPRTPWFTGKLVEWEAEGRRAAVWNLSPEWKNFTNCTVNVSYKSFLFFF